MIVVADTGPINYLIWIHEIDILPRLYGRVLIPPSVRDELRLGRAPDAVRLWIAKPPEWLEVRIPTVVPDTDLIIAGLDQGERDAILLAEQLEADKLLIDDLAGRKEARRRQLGYIGTLGILETAGREGLLDLRDAVSRLRRTNFHVSQELIDRLLGH